MRFENILCRDFCSFFVEHDFLRSIFYNRRNLLFTPSELLADVWVLRLVREDILLSWWLTLLINLKLWKYTNWKNNFKIDNSSLEIFICSFLWTVWPLQSIRSILFNKILKSPSGVIHAQSIEFVDKCVSTFAGLSLFFIFHPIKKKHCFSSGHNDSWICNDVHVYLNLDSFWKISFQPEDSPNHLCFSTFRSKYLAKNSVFSFPLA